VGGGHREVAVHEGRLIVALAASAVICELDMPRLELLVEAAEPLLVELVVLDELAELGEVEATVLLPVLQQRLDLVVRHALVIPPGFLRSIPISARCPPMHRSRARFDTRARRPTSARAATSCRRDRGGADSAARSRP